MTETDNKEKTDAPADAVPHGLREKNLKVAGLSFMLADIALISYGLALGKFEVGSAGVLGLLSGFTGARYGNPKSEKQLEQIERRLGAYLRRQGVEIPKNPSTALLTKEGGLIDHIESFLYTYPTQIMTALYTLVGVQFARDGMRKKTWDMKAAGGFLIAGALGGLLINEKKPDPEHPPQGVMHKAWSWIQEKPLRLTGTLFTLNNVMLTADALKERRQNPAQKSYLFKILAAASFAFGNALMALSSKSYGGGSKMDEKTLNQLAETSARVIAAQPQKLQDALLERVTGFLSSQSNVNLNAEQISTLLHGKLAEVASAYPPAGWQGRVGDAKAATPQPSL